MPPLAVPVVAQLRVLGRKWEELHPFTDPGTLDRATRLGCIKARAAFWLAHHLTELSPSAPLAGICSTCGQGTFSWCEGCYRRIGEESGRVFSAVCQHCDKEQLVCPCCQAAGVTWEAGHETYLADHGLQEEYQEGVEITPEDGGPPQRVTFAELGRRLGRSPEELKAEILGALGGGGCTDPSDPWWAQWKHTLQRCEASWNPYRLRWPCLRPGILESCYALEGPKVKIIGVHRRDDNRQGDL